MKVLRGFFQLVAGFVLAAAVLYGTATALLMVFPGLVGNWTTMSTGARVGVSAAGYGLLLIIALVAWKRARLIGVGVLLLIPIDFVASALS